MNLAPIVLFVYNRPWHTRKTLEALAKNEYAEQSALFIYSDGPKSDANEQEHKQIQEVRSIIQSKKWCKEVTIKEAPENLGLADSIIKGVTEVVEKHGAVIVLEDDIVTSKGFLKYMNDALNLYENEKQVMHIAASMLPIKEQLPETFFFNVCSCHGWATWSRAWQHLRTDPFELLLELKDKDLLDRFNIEGTENFANQLERNISGALHTWAIKWYATVFLKNGFCLHPKKSIVNNIGCDGSGVHFDINFDYQTRHPATSIDVKSIPIEEEQNVRELARRFYKKNNNKSIPERILLKIRSIPVRISNLTKR